MDIRTEGHEEDFFPSLYFFKTEGRLSRRGFVLTLAALFGGVGLFFALYVCLVLPILYGVSDLFLHRLQAFWALSTASFFITLFGVLILLPLLAVPAAVRRLHDTGHSGHWALPALLAVLGAAQLILQGIIYLISDLLYGAITLAGILLHDSLYCIILLLGGLYPLAALLSVLCCILSIIGIMRLLQPDSR